MEEMKRNFQFHLGFTLVEILIVISIIVIITTIMFSGNIQSSFQKTRDSKRKQDLNKLIRILEDYYNDKSYYPPPNDPENGRIRNAPWGSAFPPYIAELPLDPLNPNQSYYYQSDVLKKFFVIYAKLENTSDDEIKRLGCEFGCGPQNPQGGRDYNYYVSSPEVVMVSGIPPDEDPGLDPTYVPASGTPTPTFNPNPPSGPYACAHNQCCSYNDCGDLVKPPGVYCGPASKCWYQSIVPPFSWQCKDAFTPPESC